MKQVKGGVEKGEPKRTKPKQKMRLALPDTTEKDFIERRGSRGDSLRKLARKSKTRESSVARVIKVDAMARRRNPFGTFKIAEARAQKRLARAKKMESAG